MHSIFLGEGVVVEEGRVEDNDVGPGSAKSDDSCRA